MRGEDAENVRRRETKKARSAWAGRGGTNPRASAGFFAWSGRRKSVRKGNEESPLGWAGAVFAGRGAHPRASAGFCRE